MHRRQIKTLINWLALPKRFSQQKKISKGGLQTSQSSVCSLPTLEGLSWLRGQKNHPVAQPTPLWHTRHPTHTYTHHVVVAPLFFSFHCSGLADVTGECMNLTYMRHDAYLDGGGEKKKRKNIPRELRRITKMPLKFQREGHQSGNLISMRFRIEGLPSLPFQIFGCN